MCEGGGEVAGRREAVVIAWWDGQVLFVIEAVIEWKVRDQSGGGGGKRDHVLSRICDLEASTPSVLRRL